MLLFCDTVIYGLSFFFFLRHKNPQSPFPSQTATPTPTKKLCNSDRKGSTAFDTNML